MIDHTKWAEYLLDAEAKVEAVAPITDVEPDLTIEDAYLIQDKILERKLADGERLIGAKLGLTSRAKQESMGVHEPIYAWLTDRMLSPLEAPIALDELIHPRAEPEIVFVLERDLAGPGVSAQAVLDATAAVCCGIEVIDSRYADFRFTLPDVVRARPAPRPARLRPHPRGLPSRGRPAPRGDRRWRGGARPPRGSSGAPRERPGGARPKARSRLDRALGRADGRPSARAGREHHRDLRPARFSQRSRGSTKYVAVALITRRI
jgi:hypothetical protein